jgi:Mn-dependent DtxR family transcriptional regulator
MRDVREVIRLHRDGAVAMREIARMIGVARSTVRDMILRFERSDLW